MKDAWVLRATALSKDYPLGLTAAERLRRMWAVTTAPASHAVRAVSNVDLTVMRGETVGIVGKNGCGKSTLLQLLSGVLEPSSGRLERRGSTAALLELGAGFHPDFTGHENIRLKASVLGLTPRQVNDRMDEILAFADIGEAIERPIRTYSSGMFARLAFSVAIAVEPDLLVIDETLAVGDEAFQRKCFARLEEIRDSGGATLFVSHSAHAVLEICDRALLMDRGEVLMNDEPKRVVAEYQRLLYTPQAMQDRVREELRGDRGGESPGTASPPGRITTPAPRNQPDAYDPDLTPASTQVYEEVGAGIREPVLLSLDGNSVNVLHSRRRYRFEYDVEFTADCFDVRFHMLVKRINGTELGGGVAPDIEHPGSSHRAGSTVRVAFEFECCLNTDAYFVNCGVTGNGGTQLHRIVDALMFRVFPSPRTNAFGTVHFDCRPSVSAGTAERATSAA